MSLFRTDNRLCDGGMGSIRRLRIATLYDESVWRCCARIQAIPDYRGDSTNGIFIGLVQSLENVLRARPKGVSTRELCTFDCITFWHSR